MNAETVKEYVLAGIESLPTASSVSMNERTYQAIRNSADYKQSPVETYCGLEIKIIPNMEDGKIFVTAATPFNPTQNPFQY